MSIEQREALLLTSVILIIGLMAMPEASRPLTGGVGTVLGEISFPLYLVHTLVILSVGSHAYIKLGLVGAASVTCLACFCALVPFVYLERWWVPLVNRWAKKLALSFRKEA